MRQISDEMIEAEENLLIDIQVLLQHLISEKNVSRSELADKAGISKARLSQLLSSEANPTVKSCARLFQALGETLSVGIRPKGVSGASEPADDFKSTVFADWRLDISASDDLRQSSDGRDAQLVAVLKETFVSNDNYKNQVLIIDGHVEFDEAA